jgi:ATP-dependent DNA ligase
MKKVLPALFRPATSGKTLMWQIEVSDHVIQGQAVIRVSSGLQDGTRQVFSTIIEKGKNIGKSNETSAFEQALKEAQSGWEKAKKKGYTENLENYAAPRKPMAAHTLSDCLHKLTWPAIVQPKLEGIHCKVVKKGPREIHYLSRDNNRFLNLEYMTPFYSEILAVGEEIGSELYAHDNSSLIIQDCGSLVLPPTRIHFEDIVSLVKGSEYAHDRELLIKSHMFDLPSGLPIEERLAELERRFSLLPDHCPIDIVPHYLVDNEEQFFEAHEGFKADGYEGTMYRRLGSPYVYDYRSYDLLKHKDFLDKEFPIVEIREGKGKFAGKAVFLCLADNGLPFEVITRGSAEKKEEYFRNAVDLVGGLMTVRYQRLTKRGVPYLPVGNLRNYE